jgi:hypothetical protein
MNQEKHMQIIPIIGVTVLNIILGMLWYSPVLFGHPWAKAYKLDNRKMKPTPGHYVGSIIVSLVTASVLSFLVDHFTIMTAGRAACLAFFLWLGLIVTTHFSGVIWAGKPLKAYLIEMPYQLISLVMMTTILTVWQ